MLLRRQTRLPERPDRRKAASGYSTSAELAGEVEETAVEHGPLSTVEASCVTEEVVVIRQERIEAWRVVRHVLEHGVTTVTTAMSSNVYSL